MASLPPEPSREFEDRDQVREHVRRVAQTYLDSADPNLRAQARAVLREIDKRQGKPSEDSAE